MVFSQKNGSSALPPNNRVALNSRLRYNLDRDAAYRSCFLIDSTNGEIIGPEFYSRPVGPSDRMVLESLHGEWFPITYPHEYYDNLQNGKFETVAVCYRTCNESQVNSIYQYLSHFWRPQAPQDFIAGLGVLSYNTIILEEDIVRLLTYKTSQFVDEDIRAISSELEKFVGMRYEALHSRQKLDLKSNIGYIVTLGVTEEFRGKGIAKYILNHIKQQAIRSRKAVNLPPPSPCCDHPFILPILQMLYLHVVDYNKAAIDMYIKHGFSLAYSLPVRNTSHPTPTPTMFITPPKDFVLLPICLLPIWMQNYYQIYDEPYPAFLAVWESTQGSSAYREFIYKSAEAFTAQRRAHFRLLNEKA
ncbi:GNAT family acetyltransferase [Gregarina niphandrodes]|uniref:N-alpha-acetyltransferase 60 n=1 Tax=Gregarina niphandrodes TaxID=110365 RepID=A0A023B7N2_GRENI|nr:GNAT family acetyltransferase [Gregarina niphandrodes]EZG67633.1 GNAT family acetyltransferase [Gregarina niphandrodes]|eukprot:XP_011130186.1 GNAT family acetyltransferase [Gregarina niphandrodes]